MKTTESEQKMSPALTRIHEAAIGLFAEKGSSDITVSELAQAAGIARGTVYNNLESTDTLFEEIAARLAAEMLDRIVASFADIEDPAQRLARGMRLFIRRAHEEPSWGRFFNRFALTTASLQAVWTGAPMADVLTGMTSSRYALSAEQLPGVMAMIAGTVLTSMLLVLEGHQTWRQAGTDAAELVLRALGLPQDEAREIANADLPPLPELDQP
ncbi:MAG: TetR family transcriptional regulator [Myxococcota bacterium]